MKGKDHSMILHPYLTFTTSLGFQWLPKETTPDCSWYSVTSAWNTTMRARPNTHMIHMNLESNHCIIYTRDNYHHFVAITSDTWNTNRFLYILNVKYVYIHVHTWLIKLEPEVTYCILQHISAALWQPAWGVPWWTSQNPSTTSEEIK